LCFLFVEIRTMDKVQKLNSNDHHDSIQGAEVCNFAPRDRSHGNQYTEGWQFCKLYIRGNFLLLFDVEPRTDGSVACDLVVVLTALPFGRLHMLLKNAVFWDVTLCGSCKNRHFGVMYRFHRLAR
jgi:hypothetical protein